MKRIKLKFRKGKVHTTTNNGIKSIKVREYLKRHSLQKQTRLVEVDGITYDIGGVIAILNKEEPGFVDFLESKGALVNLSANGEPVKKHSKKK